MRYEIVGYDEAFLEHKIKNKATKEETLVDLFVNDTIFIGGEPVTDTKIDKVGYIKFCKSLVGKTCHIKEILEGRYGYYGKDVTIL